MPSQVLHCSIQLFFIAKVIQLVNNQFTVVTADELKHNFFGLQHSIMSGTINELLNTLVYHFLFFLQGNSIRTQKVTWCDLRDNHVRYMIQSYRWHTESLVVILPSWTQDSTSVLGAEKCVETMWHPLSGGRAEGSLITSEGVSLHCLTSVTDFVHYLGNLQLTHW